MHTRYAIFKSLKIPVSWSIHPLFTVKHWNPLFQLETATHDCLCLTLWQRTVVLAPKELQPLLRVVSNRCLTQTTPTQTSDPYPDIGPLSRHSVNWHKLKRSALQPMIHFASKIRTFFGHRYFHSLKIQIQQHSDVWTLHQEVPLGRVLKYWYPRGAQKLGGNKAKVFASNPSKQECKG